MIAYALRDAGMEVVYTGLRRSTDEIVKAAVDEDVDAVGLSILSGLHIPLTGKVMDGLKAAGCGDEIAVFVGGTIPPRDIEPLEQLGVAAVFPTGTPLSRVAPRFARSWWHVVNRRITQRRFRERCSPNWDRA